MVAFNAAIHFSYAEVAAQNVRRFIQLFGISWHFSITPFPAVAIIIAVAADEAAGHIYIVVLIHMNEWGVHIYGATAAGSLFTHVRVYAWLLISCAIFSPDLYSKTL